MLSEEDLVHTFESCVDEQAKRKDIVNKETVLQSKRQEERKMSVCVCQI
jgi:hypothetical protein